jgi:RNA polymerase sigma-B factor
VEERFAELRTTGDLELRSAIIRDYSWLAEHCAGRFRRRGEPHDDLVQVAYVGLVKAVDRYDPARQAIFTSFAVPTILGELRRHFRDSAWLVKPPRHVQELGLAVQQIRENLWQELAHEPTARDIADYLDVPVEDVLDALMAKDGYQPTSLDAPVDSDQPDGVIGHDCLVDERADHAQTEARILLEQLTADLDDREREILRLRFEEDLTQREIGDRVGCSQMHVSRLLQCMLQRLSVNVLAIEG